MICRNLFVQTATKKRCRALWIGFAFEDGDESDEGRDRGGGRIFVSTRRITGAWIATRRGRIVTATFLFRHSHRVALFDWMTYSGFNMSGYNVSSTTTSSLTNRNTHTKSAKLYWLAFAYVPIQFSYFGGCGGGVVSSAIIVVEEHSRRLQKLQVNRTNNASRKKDKQYIVFVLILRTILF